MKKKKPCFTGGRTFQVRSVSRDIFLNIFFLLVAKMTPLKNNKISKKSAIFWRKILEKAFQLFPNIFSQIFLDFSKKWLVLHVSFSKLSKKKKKKKKIYQNGKSGSVAPLKQGFLFCGLSCFFFYQAMYMYSETLFYGRTDLTSRVGQSEYFFKYFFSFWWQK